MRVSKISIQRAEAYLRVSADLAHSTEFEFPFHSRKARFPNAIERNESAAFIYVYIHWRSRHCTEMRSLVLCRASIIARRCYRRILVGSDREAIGQRKRGAQSNREIYKWNIVGLCATGRKNNNWKRVRHYVTARMQSSYMVIYAAAPRRPRRIDSGETSSAYSAQGGRSQKRALETL